MQPVNNDQDEEWVRLGLEAHVAGKMADAERYYRQALRMNPRHAVATQNLGVLLAQSNQLNEALLTIERAAMFDGVKPIIHVNRAFMCLEADRIDEALASAKRAIEISKEHNESPEEKYGFTAARLALAMISTTAGMPEDSVSLYRELLEKEPAHPTASSNICFVQTLTNSTPKDLMEQRKAWYEANRFKGEKKPHNNIKTTNRPIRVGYVGGDFKRHSAAMIFGNVLLNHNPANVEMYLYSSLPVDPAKDDLTKRFMDKVGANWRDISAKNDEEAETIIRKDGIDILVDLAAHTGGGRLTLFTRKPAPVQVTGWGFAHGTGVPEIDYFFADPIAVTAEERQYFVEKIYDLPCVVTYLPPAEYNLKGTSKLPYHENECITFGSYARYEKLSDDCLKAFAEILRRVPGSKIQFKDHAFRRPYSIRRIMNAMPDIEPERLLFSISTTHPEHMLAYQQCDLALDPWPHGGGVVMLEQLYMGLPLVTLRGKQTSGRSAASVLTILGMSAFVADTPEKYVETAVAAASDTGMLQQCRKELRKRFLDSSVVSGYVQKVEDAYMMMWKEWCGK